MLDVCKAAVEDKKKVRGRWEGLAREHGRVLFLDRPFLDSA